VPSDRTSFSIKGNNYIVDDNLLAFANETILNTDSLEDFKRGLCITHGSNYGMTATEISNALGISRKTVLIYRKEISDIFEGK
jgi:hypothetical protein